MELEKVYLEKLNNTLKKHFAEAHYSFSKRHDAVCLIKEDGNWKVFYSERGADFNVSYHDNIMEACIEMIRRLAEKDEESDIINEFLEICVA